MVDTRSNGSKAAKEALLKELDYRELKELASAASAEHPSVVGKIKARSRKALLEILSQEACLMTCLKVVLGVLQVKAGRESAATASRALEEEREAAAAERRAARASKKKKAMSTRDKALADLRAQVKAREAELEAQRSGVSELAMQQIAALVAAQMQAQAGEQKGKAAQSEEEGLSSEEALSLSGESGSEEVEFTKSSPASKPKRRRGRDKWVEPPKPKRPRREETRSEKTLRRRDERRERERSQLVETLAKAGRSSAGASLKELRKRVDSLRKEEELGSEEDSSWGDLSDVDFEGDKRNRHLERELRQLKEVMNGVLQKDEAKEKLARLKLPGNKKQYGFIAEQQARLLEMEKVLRAKSGKSRGLSVEEVGTLRVLLDDELRAMDQRVEDLKKEARLMRAQKRLNVRQAKVE